MTIYIGAHINREKTLLKTMEVMTTYGGNALQIFAGNPRSAQTVNISNYSSIADDVHKYIKTNDFKLVIHAPYTINLAKEFKNGKKTIDIADCYWIQCLLNQLEIANIINATGVVVHVGKHTSQSYEEGLNNMYIAVKYIINVLAKMQSNSKLIIETPAGQGTELLKNLEDFIAFFNSFTTEEKKYLGICLDTAHVWSAGYELHDAFEMLFSKNAKDIVVVHYNNSIEKKSSMLDRHAPILSGEIPKINMQTFLVALKKQKHVPIIILETPSDISKELTWISQS